MLCKNPAVDDKYYKITKKIWNERFWLFKKLKENNKWRSLISVFNKCNPGRVQCLKTKFGFISLSHFFSPSSTLAKGPAKASVSAGSPNPEETGGVAYTDFQLLDIFVENSSPKATWLEPGNEKNKDLIATFNINPFNTNRMLFRAHKTANFSVLLSLHCGVSYSW